MVSSTTSETETTDESWIAFDKDRCVAFGAPTDVAAAVKQRVDAEPEASVLVVDARSSFPVELDLRGALAEVVARVQAGCGTASASLPNPEGIPETDSGRPAARSPGRPKLGVTAREVTLLPRHWNWLSRQSGGASVALRKLVDQAIRANAEVDRLRETRESAYRFMTAIAGNAPGHEEAVRALFAGDIEKLRATIEPWSEDVRAHVLRLVEPV